MNKTMKRALGLLLALLMLVSAGAMQFAEAASWVGVADGLKVMSVTQTQIKIKWNKVSGASGYCVYAYQTSNGTWRQKATTTKNYFVDKDLKPGSKQAYKIRVYVMEDGVRNLGRFSDKLAAVTCPANVTGLKAAAQGAKTVRLSWSAAKGATGYTIYEKREGGDFEEVATARKNNYTMQYDASPGAVWFRVRAFAKSGDVVQYAAKYSKTVRATLKVPVPAQPKQPAAAVGSGKASVLPDGEVGSFRKIVLDWATVSGAEGYQVQQYVNGTWMDAAAGPDALHVKTYTRNKTERAYCSFPVAGKADEGVHRYRVAAAVRQGDGWVYGAYSDPVSVTYNYEPEPNIRYTDSGSFSGLVGYLYDVDENVFFTAKDLNRRGLGSNNTYWNTSLDTTRFRFLYQGDQWMLQTWKGQYGAVLYGAELGVYKNYTGRDGKYDAVQDVDYLLISMDFERYYTADDGKGGAWKHEFSRPYGTYDWCSGYMLGDTPRAIPALSGSVNENIYKQTNPDLRANYRVTVQDFEMLYALTDALKTQGYKAVTYRAKAKPGNLEYAVNGLNVYFPF